MFFIYLLEASIVVVPSEASWADLSGHNMLAMTNNQTSQRPKAICESNHAGCLVCLRIWTTSDAEAEASREYEARKNKKKKKLEELIAPVNVNKATCSKPVLGEMERK